MDAIDTLTRQHEEGLKQLDILGKSARELRDKGCSEEVMERFVSSLNLIEAEIREHNHKEEEFLFPLLDKLLSPQGITYVMRSEHQKLWDSLTRLGALAVELEKDRQNKKAIEEIAHTAGFVCGLLTAHIDKENNILFPMARKFLSEEQLSEVAKQIG
jgi:hemerythrin-like domain-containing protein